MARRTPPTAESSLQNELQQTKPFESAAQAAILGLLRTTDVARRALAAVIEAEGLTLQQYNVLRILRGAAGDGLPTLLVGERMVEQTPGVTRLLDRLEAKGLVRRERCATDRRQHLCWITDRGLALLRGLDQPVRAAGERMMTALDAKERDTLIRLLDRIRGGLPARRRARPVG